MASTPQGISPRKDASIYEVSDYIAVPPSKDYVLVRHYRTRHLEDGHLINEPVAPTEELLEGMIRAFEGRCLRQAGTLRGSFQDSRRARDCADAVNAYHRKKAEVVDKDLFITL